MQDAATPAAIIENIPTELRILPQWVCWEYRERDGRRTKVPVKPDGRSASSTDPATWSDFETVRKAASGFDGIGFVTASTDPYVLIDLDHVIGTDGFVLDWADPIIDAANIEGAYVERSVSATGYHIIGRGGQRETGAKRNDCEIYTSGRFFTMSGDVVSTPSGSLGELSETVRLVLERIGPDKKKAPRSVVPSVLNFDDETLIQKARRSKNSAKFTALFAGDGTDYVRGDGTVDASAADLALASVLAFWTGRDVAQIERIMRRSGLARAKWDEPRGDTTYLRQTIRVAVDSCGETYSGKGAKQDSKGGRLPVGEPASCGSIQIEDFYAYMPEHRYLFVPSRDLWPASSVNARVVVTTDDKPSEWLDKYRPIDQMTWSPADPMIVRDRIVASGGWMDRPGVVVFNQYLPPQIQPGDPTDIGPWLDHLRRLYGNGCDHISLWLAHRVQRPGEKINHAIVLGGSQGVGKDTLLEPVKYAVGPWNFQEVQPAHMLGRFNGFVKSVILRVSEARDLGDVDRYAFYDHMKVYTAAPPDVLRCDEKNIREYNVLNVMGVIITTNHKTDGIYLPADDRRHYVAWSDLSKDDFSPDYWRTLYGWYEAGGKENVAAYLAQLDLSGFDPKAPPPKTAAFWDVVDANRAPEDAEMADALDRLDNPVVVTVDMVRERATDSMAEWMGDRRNRRQIPHRLESAGYIPVRNPAADDGLWKFMSGRKVVYGRRDQSERDRHAAVAALIRSGR
jgi:hypothetical protein